MRVCAFGSFDRAFDRSWILLEALEESGAAVIYCHFDLWSGHRHKVNLFPWRWLLLVGRYLRGLFSISRQFLRSERSDVLYVGYMGQLDLLTAYVLNQRRHSTLVFDPCISLYNTLVEDRRLVKANGLAARLIRYLDVLPCRLADVVLTDTAAHAKYFEDVLGIDGRKLHPVFIGATRDWQHARWEPAADGPFRVLFFAKFSPLHGMEVILDAVSRLRDRPIHFTFVGGGQLEEAIKAAAARSDRAKLEWIPWLERDALIERMRTCHVNLGIFGETIKAAMVIPNKVFQSLAMGVPVITRDSPAIRELLVDGRSAVLCGTSGEALAGAIVAAVDDFARLQAIGACGREVFARRAEQAELAGQFRQALPADQARTLPSGRP